jgi:predicted ATP-grasp superfamily ATP-dependent carboligase
MSPTDRVNPVIVMGVERRITVPVARSLYRSGVPVWVASLSGADPVLRSRALAGYFRLPDPNRRPGDFLSTLCGRAKAIGADMLIPATDGALAAISVHYDELNHHLQVACPRPAAVNRVLNKEITLRIAESVGVRVPREYKVVDGTFPAVVQGMTFPVIAKPRQKSASENFKIRHFRTAEEVTSAFENGSIGDAIVQEYCEGCGVGLEMLVHGGNCVAAFQHRRLHEYPSAGGVAVEAVAESVDPQLADVSLKLLRALEWEGVAMVEFRRDRRTGVSALMEVNGRYWGSVSLALQAGVDFPRYQWQLAHGESPAVPAKYAVGMVWHWSAGSLKRWHEVLTGRGRGLPEDSQPGQRPGQGQRRNALWRLEDPLPVLLEWLDAGKQLVRSDAQALMKRILPQRASTKQPVPETTESGVQGGEAYGK